MRGHVVFALAVPSLAAADRRQPEPASQRHGVQYAHGMGDNKY